TSSCCESGVEPTWADWQSMQLKESVRCCMKRLLRLYCFGRLSHLSQPLVVFAEFGNNRAVERVSITRDRLTLIFEKVRALRGFIESGYPSLSESSLRMLGEELFNVVFVDTVKRLFDQATGTDQAVIPIELL